MNGDHVDRRLWRTELLARGDGWSLHVDGRPIANTSEPLTNGQAHDWARQQLGEGVRFEPVLMDPYAERQLAEGNRIDWVANPEQGNRRRAQG